jgi:hypothetical protein
MDSKDLGILGAQARGVILVVGVITLFTQSWTFLPSNPHISHGLKTVING